MISIQKNINLAQFTTFKIGGPAKEFVLVKNETELIEALQHAKENNFKYYILGGGSNLFFDDRGFDGLVIRLGANDDMRMMAENQVACWAGESLGGLVNFDKENNLSGLESLAGIPGTVGGAVRGNAGAFGVEMKDLIESVRALDVNDLKIKDYSVAECGFGYRKSIFKERRDLVVLAVTVKLQSGNKAEIEQKMKEAIQRRNEKQPTGWVGSAGSFFENPKVDKQELIEKFERDTGAKSRDGKIPAGWLITEAGLRGKRIGGIEVSEKHANFVLNIGGGTAEQVIMLASIIKQKVRTKAAIQLREEVSYVSY